MPEAVSEALDAVSSPDTATANDTTPESVVTPDAKPEAEPTSDASSKDANATPDTSSVDEPKAKPEKEAKKRELKDVVRDALKTQDKADKEGKPEAKDKQEVETPDEDASKADAESDGKEFHNHPRWKQIISERDQAKTELEKLTPAAQQYQKISEFMEQHQIPAQEMADAMVVVAMMKNPETIGQAVQKLEGLIAQGKAMLGTGIDQDLQSRVDEGEISEAYAKELTKVRAEARTTREAAMRYSQQAQQSSQQAQQAQTAAMQGQARDKATAYLTSKQSTDPDFNLKAPMLGHVVRSLRAEHQGPMTPEAAEQIMARAYEEVTKVLQSTRPAKKPTPPSPQAGKPGTGGASVAPKSLQEAIALGMNQGTAA